MGLVGRGDVEENSRMLPIRVFYHARTRLLKNSVFFLSYRPLHVYTGFVYINVQFCWILAKFFSLTMFVRGTLSTVPRKAVSLVPRAYLLVNTE